MQVIYLFYEKKYGGNYPSTCCILAPIQYIKTISEQQSLLNNCKLLWVFCCCLFNMLTMPLAPITCQL